MPLKNLYSATISGRHWNFMTAPLVTLKKGSAGASEIPQWAQNYYLWVHTKCLPMWAQSFCLHGCNIIASMGTKLQNNCLWVHTKCSPMWAQKFCFQECNIIASMGAKLLPYKCVHIGHTLKFWAQRQPPKRCANTSTLTLGALWKFGCRNNQLKNAAKIPHSHWAHSENLGAGIIS